MSNASRYSIVIPVYQNRESLPELLQALESLNADLAGLLEVVFVIDGSPDDSADFLVSTLPSCRFQSLLLLHSRNFGSFAAIRSGLSQATGPYFAVMAADLQEPPELMLDFFRSLESEPIDVTVGTRTGRDDPLLSRWASALFWSLYRRLVEPEMPHGGVDVFGCNQQVRDHLIDLDEANSSLVGLLFWLGFRRKEVPYRRLRRQHGSSAWTWSGKLRYLFDSAFSFSDLPIRLLILGGATGVVISVTFALVVLVARFLRLIPVPGYAAIVLAITFFAAVNTLSLGIVGGYIWRAFENSKGRPGAVVRSTSRFEGKS